MTDSRNIFISVLFSGVILNSKGLFKICFVLCLEMKIYQIFSLEYIFQV